METSDQIEMGATSWRRMACFTALLAAASGCTVQSEDAEDFSALAQPVENGELRPSHLNGGAVRIKVYNSDSSSSLYCSGQVISRDSILTAAHCFYNVGHFSDGWSSSITVPVEVRHQNANNTWENLTPNGSTNKVNATVYVRSAYHPLNVADDPLKRGYDVAVLQTPSNLANTASGDVSAFARYTSQKPEWMFLYGYGYHTDSSWDGQLRRGYLENLSWSTSSSNTYYRTIKSDYGSSDAHACNRDSGGPWKMQSIDFAPESGVQFGVQTSGSGDGNCRESSARAAMVAYHATWIEDRVEDGNGSCSNDTHTVLPYLSNWNMLTINTTVCW